jgi:hypothetical protein
MQQCNFHSVPNFEECSGGVTMKCELIFWDLLGMFLIFNCCQFELATRAEPLHYEPFIFQVCLIQL